MANFHTIITIVHLIGVVVGAGAAFTSDALFFSFLRTRSFGDREIRMLKVGSRVVWLGMLILITSGIVLFLFDPNRYLHSPKFIAKMTIVAVIIINGLIFHHVHMPRLMQGQLTRSLFISGGISMVSWISAIILGAMGRSPLSYPTIMGMYLLLLMIGISGALITHRRVQE